jgi:hypothetical protein
MRYSASPNSIPVIVVLVLSTTCQIGVCTIETWQLTTWRHTACVLNRKICSTCHNDHSAQRRTISKHPSICQRSMQCPWSDLVTMDLGNPQELAFSIQLVLTVSFVHQQSAASTPALQPSQRAAWSPASSQLQSEEL